MSTDDKFLFADEQPEKPSTTDKECWKVLIVDDEAEVHSVTKLVLNKVVFYGRCLEIYSAYSGKEACKIMRNNPDMAFVLCDVVMETEHAGLDVIRYIRNELDNHLVRLVLRTGQPGQAPEREIIEQYDVNDYKEKTELTSSKLHSLSYACLRSYLDLMRLEVHRQGLERIINSSKAFFVTQHLSRFAQTLVEQLVYLLSNVDEFNELRDGGLFFKLQADKTWTVEFRIGLYAEQPQQELDDELIDLVNDVFYKQTPLYTPNFTAIFFATSDGSKHVVAVNKGLYEGKHGAIEPPLLNMLAANVRIAAENVYLNREIEETTKEICYRLGEAIETRSKETGNHVKRVALISELLALKYGLSEREAELIKQASPMHDLGKVAIPDLILHKPGKLDDEEWITMRTHTQIGYEILNGSNSPVLKMAAIIAHEHHEKYNGQGYPRGLVGQDIHIAGRITAVADVFDALASKRCYKEAWPMDKILELFKQERAEHFDPKLVDILFKSLDEILAIRDKYRD